MSFLSIWWYLVFRPDLTNEVILQLSHHSFVCVKGFCRNVTFNNFRDVAWKVDIAFYVVCNRRTFKFKPQMIFCRQYNCLSLLNQWWKCSYKYEFSQELISRIFPFSISGFSSEKSDVIVKVFAVLLPECFFQLFCELAYNGVLSSTSLFPLVSCLTLFAIL